LIESAQATPAGLEIPELLQRRLRSRVRQGLDALVRQGKRPIVLCAPHLRRAVEDLARQDEPAAAVLGYNEVRTLEVQPVEVTGDES
jgi:flagellar biosynthesis component FlhA